MSHLFAVSTARHHSARALRRHLRRFVSAPSPPAHPHRSPSMHAFVEVIGPGAHDSSSSLQLFFDDSRYLFECGDGTQRLCTEYTIKLARLRAIFLSSLAPPSVGGLLGMVLTIADAGKDQVAIAAPNGISKLFHAARPFFYRPSLSSTVVDIPMHSGSAAKHTVVRQDENVTIRAVPIRCRRDVEINGSFAAHYDAVSYVCKLRDIRGKFNPTKAVQLGVPKGRNFGILQKGQSVTTPSGKLVNPADVMSPSTPGPILVILACPSLDHVQSVVSSTSLDPNHLGVLSIPSNANQPQQSCVVFHLGPKQVLADPVYQQWCDSFGPHVGHVPLHSSAAPERTVFSSQAENIDLLHNALDREIFPLPCQIFAPNSSETAAESNGTSAHPSTMCQVASGRVGKWIDADCRLRYTLSPVANFGPDQSAVRPRFLERKAAHPTFPWRQAAQFSQEQEPAGSEMKTPSCISSMSPGTAAVRFLGTGGAIPAKYRNVSGILLDLFERGGVIFDCGEGTWGQMVRIFGLDRAQKALCRLKIVFISHMHADHHLGLTTLLHQRSEALATHTEYQDGPQLVIIGPQPLHAWLESVEAATRAALREQFGHGGARYRFFNAECLKDPQAPEAKFFPDAFGLELGCVDVIHCPLSYGVSVRDCLSGWKVVYSGDTRPCERLAEMGKDATLAIHEATLDDDKRTEAIEKSHCTTSEALDICGKKMRAWRTILTHFSQRYPKIPKLDEATVQKMRENRASVAFDLMSVDFTRLDELPKIVPALRQVFPDEVEDDCFAEPAMRSDVT